LAKKLNQTDSNCKLDSTNKLGSHWTGWSDPCGWLECGWMAAGNVNKYQLSLTNSCNVLHHGKRAANKGGRSVW